MEVDSGVPGIIRDRLSQTPVLAHYDATLPLRLAGDASAFGLNWRKKHCP